MKTKNSSSQFFLGVIGLASLAVIGASAILVSQLLQSKQESVAPNAADQASADLSVTTCAAQFVVPGNPTPTPCIPTNKKADVSVVIDISGSMMRTRVPNGNGGFTYTRIPKIDNALNATRNLFNALLADTLAGKVNAGLSVFSTCAVNDGTVAEWPYTIDGKQVYQWPITRLKSNLVNNTGRTTLIASLDGILSTSSPLPFIPVGPIGSPRPGEQLTHTDKFRTCTHEGVEFGKQVLSGGSAEKKYLVILTDGRPYAEHQDQFPENKTPQMIKRAIDATTVAARAGVETIIVGIGDETDQGGDPNTTGGYWGDVMECMAGLKSTYTYEGVTSNCSPYDPSIPLAAGDTRRTAPGQYLYAGNYDQTVLNNLAATIYEEVSEDICLPPPAGPLQSANGTVYVPKSAIMTR